MTQADITSLMDVVTTLRAPGGCPWDQSQTHESMRKHLLEEAYEVCDAIECGDDANLCEELGDVLFHVVFQAALAEERGAFTLEDVVRGVTEKMKRRHPRIYALDDADAPTDWESIKRAEKAARSGTERLPAAMPVTLKLPKLIAKLERHGVSLVAISACCEDDVQRQTLALAAQCRAEEEDWETRAQALAKNLEDLLEDVQKS